MRSPKDPERRRAPRVPLSVDVSVQGTAGSVVCRTRDLSATGMLLHSPSPLGGGRFVRVLLSLPGTKRWLDVDALLVREAMEEGSSIYAVEFQASRAVEALLRDFTTIHGRRRPAPRPTASGNGSDPGSDGRAPAAIHQLYREALAAVRDLTKGNRPKKFIPLPPKGIH